MKKIRAEKQNIAMEKSQKQFIGKELIISNQYGESNKLSIVNIDLMRLNCTVYLQEDNLTVCFNINEHGLKPLDD